MNLSWLSHLSMSSPTGEEPAQLSILPGALRRTQLWNFPCIWISWHQLWRVVLDHTPVNVVNFTIRWGISLLSHDVLHNQYFLLNLSSIGGKTHIFACWTLMDFVRGIKVWCLQASEKPIPADLEYRWWMKFSLHKLYNQEKPSFVDSETKKAIQVSTWRHRHAVVKSRVKSEIMPYLLQCGIILNFRE